jgi:hypothetical protein
MCHDDAIMMARTQITFDPEMQRRARRRASEMGISLAEYMRRLLARDLGSSSMKLNPKCVFNLGGSGGSNIAKNKDAMIGEAAAHRHATSKTSSSR